MPNLTRRRMGAGLAAVTLTASGAAAVDIAALETAASIEGSVTWHVAQMSGEAAEAIGHRSISATEIARDLPDAIEQWRDKFGG